MRPTRAIASDETATTRFFRWIANGRFSFVVLVVDSIDFPLDRYTTFVCLDPLNFRENFRSPLVFLNSGIRQSAERRATFIRSFSAHRGAARARARASMRRFADVASIIGVIASRGRRVSANLSINIKDPVDTAPAGTHCAIPARL